MEKSTHVQQQQEQREQQQQKQQVQLPIHYSTNVPPPRPAVGKDAIALADSDRIRLINTNPTRTEVIRKVIQQGWKEGIQSEKPMGEVAHEFKLKGAPWLCVADNAVAARRLVLAVVRAMAQMGWTWIASVDFVTLGCNADTMYFELEPRLVLDPMLPMEPAEMFAMTFNCLMGVIRLIDASSYVAELISQAILAKWPKG